MRVIYHEATALVQASSTTIIVAHGREGITVRAYCVSKAVAENIAARWLARNMVRGPVHITQETNGEKQGHYVFTLGTTQRHLELELLLREAEAFVQSIAYGYSRDRFEPQVLLLIRTFPAQKLRMQAHVQCRPDITVPQAVLEAFLQKLRDHFPGAAISRQGTMFTIRLPETFIHSETELNRRTLLLIFEKLDAEIPRV